MRTACKQVDRHEGRRWGWVGPLAPTRIRAMIVRCFQDGQRRQESSEEVLRELAEH